jgi:hypothetical protein
MRQPSVQIDRKNKTVTVVMPLEKPRPSKSTGKTRVIASTGGLKTSTESYARRPLCFTANVFFYPAMPLNANESGQQHSAAGDFVEASITQRRGRRRDRTTTDTSVEE